MIAVYYDCEFTKLDQHAGLISIGLCTDRGSEFYAEFTDFDDDYCDDWVKANVISKLTMFPNENNYVIDEKANIMYMCGTTEDIHDELLRWLCREIEYYYIEYGTEDQIQFYSDCMAYDWVLLIDLLTRGRTALDLPKWVYYIPVDLSSVLWAIGEDPDIYREGFAEMKNKVESKHNALWDAKVIKECFNKIFAKLFPPDEDGPYHPVVKQTCCFS